MKTQWPDLAEKAFVLTVLLAALSAGALCTVPVLFAADESAVQETQSATPEPEASIGAEADFTLADSDGRLHHLSDLRGRWVLVNFWATWCAPCVTEIPIIQQFVESHADSLAAIGINFEEINSATLQKAIAELEIRYLVVQAGDAPILPFEPLKGLPSTFLVSPDGHIMFRHTGELTQSQLSAAWQAARARYEKEDLGDQSK